MLDSRAMGRRRVLALLGLAGVVAAVLLYLLLAVDGGEDGGPADQAADPRSRGLTTARTGEAPGIAVSRTNELGQPLDERGKPIGPPTTEKLNAFVPRIEKGELPMNPPRFDDPADRARYRAYWVRELQRRLAIWQKENPGRDFPGDGDTERMLAELYDAGELAADNEGQAALDRQKRWAELFREFLDRYGTTPGGAAAFGSDPQYGPVPEPPVRPAGYDAPEPEPAPEYDDPMTDPIRAERARRGK